MTGPLFPPRRGSGRRVAAWRRRSERAIASASHACAMCPEGAPQAGRLPSSSRHSPSRPSATEADCQLPVARRADGRPLRAAGMLTPRRAPRLSSPRRDGGGGGDGASCCGLVGKLRHRAVAPRGDAPNAASQDDAALLAHASDAQPCAERVAARRNVCVNAACARGRAWRLGSSRSVALTCLQCQNVGLDGASSASKSWRPVLGRRVRHVQTGGTSRGAWVSRRATARKAERTAC